MHVCLLFSWRTFPSAGSTGGEDQDYDARWGCPISLSVAEASPAAHVSRTYASSSHSDYAVMYIHGLMFPLVMVDDLQEHREEAALRQVI